jgi:hypothetical protein
MRLGFGRVPASPPQGGRAHQGRQSRGGEVWLCSARWCSSPLPLRQSVREGPGGAPVRPGPCGVPRCCWRVPAPLWQAAEPVDVAAARGGRRRAGDASPGDQPRGPPLALQRLALNWPRATHGMPSPAPHSVRQKAARDRLLRLAPSPPEWVLGFEAEGGWSRVAPPARRAWTASPPMQVQLLTSAPHDPAPDAMACYGFLRPATHRGMLRFVAGRPLDEVPVQCLAGRCERMAQAGKRVLCRHLGRCLLAHGGRGRPVGAGAESAGRTRGRGPGGSVQTPRGQSLVEQH